MNLYRAATHDRSSESAYYMGRLVTLAFVGVFTAVLTSGPGATAVTEEAGALIGPSLRPRGRGAQFASSSLRQSHFSKHSEFGFASAAEYERAADDFMTGPLPEGALERTRGPQMGHRAGDLVRYDPTTNEFGVLSSGGDIRTYFQPDPAEHGFSTNLEYFLFGD